jgi:hypothetical protein
MKNGYSFSFIITLSAVLSILTPASAYQLNFTPRASTSFEYTDNLFLSQENKESEFITVVSAGFTLALLEKNMGLEISYDPAYALYNDFDENDSLRHDARLLAWSDLAKNTRLEFSNRFLLTEDPLKEDELIRDDQIIIPGDTTIRRSRNEYYSNTAVLRLNHQFGLNDIVFAEFLHSFLRNDDPNIEDNDRYRPAVGLNYWFSNKYGLETRGEYTRGNFSQDREFRGTPTDNFDNWLGSLKFINLLTRNFSLFAQYDHVYRKYDGDFDDDYHLYSPSAGFQYNVSEDLYLKFALGYFYQDFDRDDKEDGLFGSGEIRKSWKYRRGSITLVSLAGLDQNDFGAQRLGLERFLSVRADAQYNFARYLVGNVFGNFHYSDPVNISEARGIEDQKRYRVGTGLTYLPLRWMALNLNYQYSKYDADVRRINNLGSGNNDKYDENRIIFMITLQPDQPYWRYGGI